MQLTASPDMFLYDDGRTRVATTEELAAGIALCAKWTREMDENRLKKEQRYERANAKYLAQQAIRDREFLAAKRKTARLAKKARQSSIQAL